MIPGRGPFQNSTSVSTLGKQIRNESSPGRNGRIRQPSIDFSYAISKAFRTEASRQAPRETIGVRSCPSDLSDGLAHPLSTIYDMIGPPTEVGWLFPGAIAGTVWVKSAAPYRKRFVRVRRSRPGLGKNRVARACSNHPRRGD